MNSPATLAGACLLLLAAALIAAGCTASPGPGPTPLPTATPVSTPVPSETPAPGTCGITTCHGLDLACGPDAPEICTMEYRLGDKCRQYARCEVSGSSCTLVKDAQFDTCKACVEQCEAAAKESPVTAFSCEEKC
jgi:hypothetical protein